MQHDYIQDNLVRMRSPVQIWPAAPFPVPASAGAGFLHLTQKVPFWDTQPIKFRHTSTRLTHRNRRAESWKTTAIRWWICRSRRQSCRDAIGRDILLLQEFMESNTGLPQQSRFHVPVLSPTPCAADAAGAGRSPGAAGPGPAEPGPEAGPGPPGRRGRR